jgi:hypothetical protein
MEVTEATAPKDLQAALEAVRDEWVKTTPQVTDKDAVESADAVARSHNDGRAPVVKMRATAIATKNAAGLDATHTGVVAMMNIAIKSTVALVAEMGGVAGSSTTASAARADYAVRVTIRGHFKPKNRKEGGIDRRFQVNIDEALLG